MDNKWKMPSNANDCILPQLVKHYQKSLQDIIGREPWKVTKVARVNGAVSVTLKALDKGSMKTMYPDYVDSMNDFLHYVGQMDEDGNYEILFPVYESDVKKHPDYASELKERLEYSKKLATKMKWKY